MSDYKDMLAEAEEDLERAYKILKISETLSEQTYAEALQNYTRCAYNVHNLRQKIKGTSK